MALQDKISAFLNTEERKQNAKTVVEIIVNTKFEDSYIVFSSE